MEISYKQEASVGVMVIAGLVAFTGAMFWLTGRSFSSHGLEVPVVFTDVGGLRVGDPIRVSGVTKGRVEHVRLEHMGRVLVTMELDPTVAPRTDATASVVSADFLGAMFVAYNPGTAAPLPAGQPIPGVTAEQFTDLAARAATSANRLIANVDSGLNPAELATDIHNTLIITQRGMKALTDLTTGPTVQQTTATLQSVQQVMNRIDSVLGTQSAATTGHRLDSLSLSLTELSTHLAQATSSLNDLLAMTTKGEGTLGRLATDTLLYNNLTSTLGALSLLLTDMKEHPGKYVTVRVF